MFVVGAIFGLLVVMVGVDTSPTKTLKKDDYATVLRLSLLFYEAQRSGHLPASNRINWRSDSALADRGSSGEDLTGGYYDASDFVKFGFTMAFTSTLLTWGLLEFEKPYTESGQYGPALEAVKWATDYFIKCHVSPFEFYGQVGDFYEDHKFWGRPEDLNMTRPAYKIDIRNPGSDLAGEVSAAFSAASLAFRNVNPEYSRVLMEHARQLFEFADKYRGLYHDVIPGAKAYYESSGYGDELTWSAIWLYRATRNSTYLDQALGFYTQFRLHDRPNEFFYNKKTAGIQFLLALETGRPEYMQAVKQFCDYSANDQVRTPKGLLFIDKVGTLSHAANVAFICLQAALHLNTSLNMSREIYTDFARGQVEYILGVKTGRSFVVGWGQNYPKQPHHAASSCPDTPKPCGWAQFYAKTPNPQILFGALVSGPDQNDYYQDLREEFLFNEVTLDFNAGFQGVIAGLMSLLQEE